MQQTIVLLFLVFALTVSKNYTGYKTYKVHVNSDDDLNFFTTFHKNFDLDFWTKPNKVGKPFTVMVAPKYQKYFENELRGRNVAFTIEIRNVESFIQSERIFHQNQLPNTDRKYSFDQYLRHDEINSYLAQLAESYPDLVAVTNIGKSYQNRSMDLIRISSGPRDPPKPVIFIDAGIHAREWIAPAFALYIINQLVENSEQNSDLTKNVDWVILPSANPDGYEYTWTEDRLWRKTVSPGQLCDGADANRNFGFHWMEAGADDFECSEIYAGKEAFSEVEARNLRGALADIENIKVYLTLHSYGQYILYPYSYADVLAENWEELQDLGDRINDAIAAVNGTEYTVGASTATMYPAAGCSDDWAKGAANISIVYVFELPGGGENGFDPPASEILPVALETFEGVKVLHAHVEQNYQ